MRKVICHMISKEYQIWLTHDGASRKVRIPVLPQTVRVTNASMNKSVDIAGLGEIIIKQDRPAYGIEFESFFPYAGFPGLASSDIIAPLALKDTILDFKNSDKPSHLIITGTNINIYVTIEDFPFEERGGDVGTIYYTLRLKEYREVAARQIKVNTVTKTATVPVKAATRTDNRVCPKTYTVVRGDSLCAIARRLLGSESRYMEIYELNRDIVKNESLIYEGQVLKLPL